MLKANIVRKPNCSIFPITLEDYDLVHYCLSGGPGYGDPLERKVDSVKKDLNDGIYTKEFVYKIYGVVANYDESKEEWGIDEKATKSRQDELMKERKEKSMTFEEFWEYERKKITEKKLYEAVTLMFSESLKLSKKWAKEFSKFWKFPENFQMEVK